ncbi:MAG: helix-turn-helix transcriptional regulator [Candidatus Thermoplasmatota archaeon]|nr:helix-turn-helix transcriptional regulator [Candidatus Thermoplasmatota archaeon]
MIEDLRAAAAEVAGDVVLDTAPGTAMRRWRTRYGFTQTWLSEHLGVRRESLSRIESGHSKPTLDVVAQFARVMALTGSVRAYAARMEKNGGSPNYVYFRTLGKELDLPPDTVDAVAREALESYSAKRDALLEGLGHEGTERP